VIDLRSDTVTEPTEAMLDAMRSATFGDDSRDGDPTVRRLEALAAERAGTEAAAFVPSGTMANLVALLTHAERGGEVVLEQGSHTLSSELGGVAAIAGLFYRPVPGRRGAMDLDRLGETVRTGTRLRMGTALIWLETTHNGAGGAVLPLEHLAAVQALAAERGLPVHIDGSRIFNAAIALGVGVPEIARHADSVAFCLSKGLSAPVGSLLCGSSPFIERARAFRRMVGGNMRQSGPLAAAGIVALETMVDRLAEDHTTARCLARGLHDVQPTSIDPATIETNIVRVSVRGSGRTAAAIAEDMDRRGVRVSASAADQLRFVTHRHIADADVDQAIAAFAEAWAGREAAVGA
jgi:threonine aldolase